MPRRRRVNLREGRSEKYNVSLREGFAAFKAFLSIMRISWSSFCKQSIDTIDELLTDFVQKGYDDELSRGLVTAGILYVQHRLKLRHRIPAAWDALRTWATNEPPTNRVPFNEVILYAVCTILMMYGMHEQGRARALHFAASVTLRCGFFGLMRPGELVRVLNSCIGLPNSFMLGGTKAAVIVVHRPKTRRYLGRRQFVLIEDGPTIDWITWWMADRGPEARLFPGSYLELRRLLNKALALLGLTHLGITLGGLRSGGATHAFKSERNLGKLQFSGRWRSASTLQYYLQEQMSAHLVTQISDSCIQNIRSLGPMVKRTSLPPPLAASVVCPWSEPARSSSHGSFVKRRGERGGD